ncbi:MAG: anaerobic ribonucleoside-triphosphate reductase activating protein [Deltaproteobacteria bacterium RBG_16_48_10]|nr:MAG: anaerobic ribonucleoside-triphosphate reductase activating protein [Deltaproteobacteria bacterium RBG_16_48_10]
MFEIKGFLETSFVDWPGKICSVLFLPYCNLRCPYCHNHSLVLHPEQHPTFPLKDILNRLLSFRGWIDGVCLTGGEPTLHADLSFLIRKIKRLGFLVKLDTNGSNPQFLEQLIAGKEVDFVSMDVKAPLEAFRYSRIAGLTVNLDLLWKSIQILKRGDVEYTFRTTVVPGLHSINDILQLGRQLKAGPRMVLQNFNPENPMDPALKKTRPYDLERLRELEREVQGMM